MLEMLAHVLGGNPLEMLGVPSGIYFPYLLVTVAALPLSIHLGWYLGWRAKSNRPRMAAALAVLIAAWANQMIYDDLLVEDPDAKVQLRGEPYARNLIVPLPFPGIRGDAFNDYLPGGRLHELTRGAQLRKVVFSSGLKVATYTTVLLHLLTYVVALSGLLTAATIGVISALRAIGTALAIRSQKYDRK
jgi:hypothetical protein